MSDTLVVAFQSQLAIVMETILKSAMMEITRLVEDSFMEEVGRGKKEVELLLRRLQFSESKLKERERRVRCADCGRATNEERTAEQPAETLSGTDTLCFSLSLREQSEKRPAFSEMWRSVDNLDSYVPTETSTRTEKKTDAFEQSGKQDSTSNNTTQIPQDVLQKLLPNAAVAGILENSTDSRERHCKTPVTDFSPNKETDFAQSRLTQSSSEKDGDGELASSPPYSAVKSEKESDPVPIKEEEEMLPVWDCCDDNRPTESDHDHRDIGGSWNREETQSSRVPPASPPSELVNVHLTNRQRTFSVVAREILTQFQVWQRASYSRNIEWGPITAKIISALPYLSGRETEVIVRCTKMLHNRRDYLRRRAKDASLERNALHMGHRYLAHLQRGDITQHGNM